MPSRHRQPEGHMAGSRVRTVSPQLGQNTTDPGVWPEGRDRSGRSRTVPQLNGLCDADTVAGGVRADSDSICHGCARRRRTLSQLRPRGCSISSQAHR